MKHYNIEKIKLYKNNLLSEKESLEIEEHIYSCDICLSEYLSLVEDMDKNKSIDKVILDFEFDMDRIIKEQVSKDNIIDINLELEKKRKNENTNKKAKINTAFLVKYIAVAASVVLLTFTGKFTSTDLFEKEVNKNKATNNIKIEENFVYQGSNLLTNKLENILFRIENPNIKKFSKLEYVY